MPSRIQFQYEHDVATTTRSFEAHRDLLTQIENKWGTTSVSKYVYRSDALGRRRDVAMTGTGAGGDRNVRWAYDDRNELTQAKWYPGTDPDATTNGYPNRQFTYTFDCIGNRTTDSGDPGVTSYTSNALNQYTGTSGPSESFSYDADGNLIADGQYTYVWDAENRLTDVHDTTLGIKSTKSLYVYDYMGRRIRKTVYPTVKVSGVYVWSTTPGLDRKFVYDGWNLVEELNALSSDAVIRKYTWGLDLSGQSGSASAAGIHGAGGIGGLLAMNDTSASKSYLYFMDANGNVMQLVDSSSGSVSAQYEYYSYGGQLAATGAAATVNPFRFSSKYWDSDPQILYYGFRYLKPRMGRWLSRDPIGELGGFNLYAAVNDDPSNETDAVGFDPSGQATTKPSSCKCKIYLTFDDGPLGGTKGILDTLSEVGLRGKATMFLVGRELERRNAKELQEMYRGYCIGNHTYSHAFYGKLDKNGNEVGEYGRFYRDPEHVRADVERTDDLLERLFSDSVERPTPCRLAGRNTWRHCGTDHTDGDSGRAADLVAGKGRMIAGWDDEFKPGKSAEEMAESIRKRCCLKQGASKPHETGKFVLLMHDKDLGRRATTRAQLKDLLQRLKREYGDCFGTLCDKKYGGCLR